MSHKLKFVVLMMRIPARGDKLKLVEHWDRGRPARLSEKLFSLSF